MSRDQHTEQDYSAESWERVKREARVFAGQGGVVATLHPDGTAAQLTATGNTSSAAMRELARLLDVWSNHS